MGRVRAGLYLVAVALLGLAAACSSGDGGGEGGDAAGTREPSTDISGLPGGENAAINEDGVDPLPPLPDDVALPIVIVHGFAGSAQQYESQAMRFSANGYPQDRIVAYEHDGAGFDVAGYTAGLDVFVDEVRRRFGVDQVYLVGHSRGTSVSSEYLATPPGPPRSRSTSPSTAGPAWTWSRVWRRPSRTTPGSPTSRSRPPRSRSRCTTSSSSASRPRSSTSSRSASPSCSRGGR